MSKNYLEYNKFNYNIYNCINKKKENDIEKLDFSFKKKLNLIFFIQVNSTKIILSIKSNNSINFNNIVLNINFDIIFSCFFINSSRFYFKNRRRKKTKTIKLTIIKIIKIQINIIEYKVVNITLNNKTKYNLINKVFAKKLALLSFNDTHINIVFINKLSIKI